MEKYDVTNGKLAKYDVATGKMVQVTSRPLAKVENYDDTNGRV